MDVASPEPNAAAVTGALYEHAPCGLLVTDDDGLVLRANATFCGWLGSTPEALVGKRRFQDLLTVGGRIFHQTQWAPLLRIQGSVAEVKLDVMRDGGAPLPAVMNAIRRERDGVMVHEIALFIAQDRHAYERELLAARKRAEVLLSEKQAAHEALERAEAAAKDRALFAEQMVGIVSHDLRNPLATIRTGTQVLQMLGMDERQQRLVDTIDRASGRGLRLVRDLLDFTRARLGQGLALERKPIDLHATVAAQLAELGHAHPDARLVHRCGGDGHCTADADRLAQLVGNLVSNAVAYGAAGAPVTVTSTTDDTGFSIAVHNEGEPVPEGLRASLFQPMVRGVDSGSETRSVGLGLYIVAEVARAHGGSIQLASSNANGTEFLARFPR